MLRASFLAARTKSEPTSSRRTVRKKKKKKTLYQKEWRTTNPQHSSRELQVRCKDIRDQSVNGGTIYTCKSSEHDGQNESHKKKKRRKEKRSVNTHINHFLNIQDTHSRSRVAYIRGGEAAGEQKGKKEKKKTEPGADTHGRQTPSRPSALLATSARRESDGGLRPHSNGSGDSNLIIPAVGLPAAAATATTPGTPTRSSGPGGAPSTRR